MALQRKFIHLGLLSSIFAAASLSASYSRAADKTAPVTEVKNTQEVYFGHTIEDPYRWLENSYSPEVKAWDNAQNMRTRAYLDKLPVRKQLYERFMASISKQSPAWYDLVPAGGKIFAQAFKPPAQQPFIVSMPLSADPRQQKIIFDPNVADPSGHIAIDWYQPSPDGKYIAVSLSRNGSEDGVLHVFDAQTGKETNEPPIEHVQYPTAGGSLAWKADSSGFWYTRYPGQEAPPEKRHFYQQVWYHNLGKPLTTDSYVFGRELPKIAEIKLDNSQNPNYLLISVANGDGGEFAHYVIGPNNHLQQITRFADHVVAGSIGADNRLYLLSRDHAPKGKILALKLDAAPADLLLDHAQLLIPEGEGAIQGGGEFGGNPVIVTPTALYVRTLKGGPTEVNIYDHDGHAKGHLPLADIASVSNLFYSGDGHVFYRQSTYLTPSAIYSYDEKTSKSTPTLLAETSPIHYEDTEVTRVFAPSKDGTMIPLNVIHLKKAKKNHPVPTLLYGYGGYGVSQTPRFLGAGTRQWLDAGGIYVIANIRGGGEYGDGWHTAGNLTHKQNVFDDFLYSAKYLIAQHYTTPAQLAILGGSNGGLLMGAALTQAPSLFRAVVALVGIYDMLHVENDPNGLFNVTEFGTVKNQDQFNAMLAYSPYHNVVKGTAYPAVFFATGVHDGRVNPMQSRKMVARLQAATSSNNPIYLSISEHAGHGIGSALSVKVGQAADYYGFLFDQLKMHLPAERHKSPRSTHRHTKK